MKERKRKPRDKVFVCVCVCVCVRERGNLKKVEAKRETKIKMELVGYIDEEEESSWAV